jgi:hypothetical protein
LLGKSGVVIDLKIVWTPTSVACRLLFKGWRTCRVREEGEGREGGEGGERGEGRGKREEGRGQREEGRGKREEEGREEGKTRTGGKGKANLRRHIRKIYNATFRTNLDRNRKYFSVVLLFRAREFFCFAESRQTPTSGFLSEF